MSDDLAMQRLIHQLHEAITAAEQLNAHAPDDPALLRVCIHLYDAVEQLEAAPVARVAPRPALRVLASVGD